MTYLCETCIHRKPCMYEEIGVTSCTYYLQERPKGRWENGFCSECGEMDSGEPNFCFNCGADMRESE